MAPGPLCTAFHDRQKWHFQMLHTSVPDDGDVSQMAMATKEHRIMQTLCSKQQSSLAKREVRKPGQTNIMWS